MTRLARTAPVLLAAGALLFAAAEALAQGNGWDIGEGALVLPNDQGVRFRVYCPTAENVYVAGEFNGWSTLAHPMTQDADGYWETTVATADPGDEYKFYVNRSLWRKDPWSFQVRDSGDAANSVIADLTAYERQATAWQTPRIEELAIYQLHVKGFQYNNDGLTYQHGEVFDHFTDTKLDYLEDLGVTCIHIMPVNEFPGEDSWGYNPVFFHAPESSYGEPEELQRLVDEAHLRGIAVVLDVVHNHTAGNDNVHFWDFDGTADIDYDDTDFGGNGQFYYDDDRALTLWGPEPDYGKPRTRERFFDNTRVLAELYRFDGFRMDAVGFIRNESSDGVDWQGWPAQDGWDYLRDFNNLARSYHNGRFLSIAEDIAGYGPITQNASEGGAGFLSQWTETDMRAVMSSPDDAARAPSRIINILGGYYPYNYGLHELIKYHSSHDKVGALNDDERLPELIGDPNAWYTRRRTALANATIMFAPGTPMLFMGDELYSIRPFQEQAGQGLDWNLLRRNQAFHAFSRDLFQLKKNAPALHENNWEVTATDDARNLVSWRRWGNDGEVLVIAANYGNFDQNFWVPFPSDGRWLEVINSSWSHYGEFDDANDRSYDVSGNWAELTIPGYSMIVLSMSHELPPGRVWDVTPVPEGHSGDGDVMLSWRGTSRAESYNVFVGATEEAVRNAGAGSPEFLGNTTNRFWGIGGAAPDVDVFWRVDSVNGIGVEQGHVRRFTPLDDSNGVAGRLDWSPAVPAEEGTVTVNYQPLYGPLDGRGDVTAHRGYTIEGSPWQGVEDVILTENPDGTWSATISVPEGTEAINLAFKHEGTEGDTYWDNNGGADWEIVVNQAAGIPDATILLY